MRIKRGSHIFVFALSLALIFSGARDALAQYLSYSGSYPGNGTVEYTNTSNTPSSVGVIGVGSGATEQVYGVAGQTGSSSGVGVGGWAYATSGSNFGVVGSSNSTSGIGVEGWAAATTGINYGGYFINSSSSGIGAKGYAAATSGTTYGGVFRADSPSGVGVRGYVSSSTGNTYGVYGEAASPYGIGVYGYNPTTGYAGYFNGKVHVNGLLSKAGGSFKIDHPLDPENKYLEHSFVESPDMMNIYNGNAILDENGEAYVTMPDYFEALNRDFQYQLTAIGVSAPGLFIKEEITGGKFKVAGGKAGMKVSWQVTGIRNDTYAQANRIKVVTNKSEDERGKLLWPMASKEPEDKDARPLLAASVPDTAENQR